MGQKISHTKYLFIEIEMGNVNCINSITKKLNSIGVEIDTTFLPKALNVSRSNKLKLFLLKVKVVKSSIKQLNDCPDVINYWELKPFIPFNNDTTL